MEVKQIGDFIAKLPDDTRVVAVIQRGRTQTVLRTDDLVCGENPSWPKAVWDGMDDALKNFPHGN